MYPEFVHRTAELCGRAHTPSPRYVLEDGVPVGVQGEWYSAALDQPIQKQEVAASVFLLTE